jgi:predicted transcriptional regulator
MSTTTSIRLPKDIRKKVEIRAKIEHRSVSNLIERYLEIALIAEENPDLPLQFIKDIQEARAEKEMGLAKPFKI